MPLPVILKQNHIAAGDPCDFPAEKSKLLRNFAGRGSAPPLQDSCRYKRSFILQARWRCFRWG